MEIFGWIIGAVVGLLALYFIIRLAVRHGIQDVRDMAVINARSGRTPRDEPDE